MKKEYKICPKCGTTMTCDRKATGKAAKRTGGYYENKVAKKMQKLTGIKFRKTPRSGGLHIPGDITCIDPDVTLPFNIECKNYNDLSLLKVFKNPKCLLTIEWKDMENEILIFNDGGTHIVVSNEKWAVLDSHRVVHAFNYFGKITLNKDLFFILTLEEFCEKLIKPLKEVEDEG
jgi:hypothetical protein